MIPTGDPYSRGIVDKAVLPEDRHNRDRVRLSWVCIVRARLDRLSLGHKASYLRSLLVCLHLLT